MAISFSTIGQDARYALRQLRKSPGFAITAILTIALGIGANTAIFTLMHAMMLRRLPVVEPERLYRIGSGDDCCVNGGMTEKQVYSDFSTEAYRTLRDNLPEFEQLAAMPSGTGDGPTLAKRAGTNQAPEKIASTFVSGNYFDLFKLKPYAGRLLNLSDDNEGASPAAVMSYTAWKNQYNSDPGVVGASFLLDSKPVTVVGIAPETFFGDRVRDNPPDFYLPISLESSLSSMGVAKNVNLRWLYLIGRLRPNVNLPALQQKSDSILRAYLSQQRAYQKPEAAKEVPKIHAEIIRVSTGVQADQQNKISKGLEILMGISALVLLIACSNIANLLLARGMARRGETSVRVALGAARSRIVRQTLTESVVLSLIGATFGIFLAYVGARAMLALAFPEAHNVPVNAVPSPIVLLFTFGAAMFTGVLFGLVPAWATLRSDPADALRGMNRTSQGGSTLPQRTLLVVQAMLSLLLITLAGLLTRSLSNLEHQNFGLSTENRIVIHLDPVASGYTPDRFEGLMRGLNDRLMAIAGTQGVAFANYSPLEGNNWGEGVFVEGRPDPTLHDDINSSWDRISPGFFSVVGQPLLRGRDFQQTDRTETPMVAIVNQKFVRKFFPSGDALGKRFGTEQHKFEYTIVGVVGDAKYQSPAGEVRPMFYRSMLQRNPNADPKDMGEVYSLAPHAVMIRTSGAQQGYEQQVRRAFNDVNSNLAISDYSTMDRQIAGLLNDERMVARLTAGFGLLALVLASIGLYGVTAYTVAQRVPEIGLRMALGSDRTSVLGMVMKGAMLQTLVGLGVGIPVTLIAGHYLESQLFGIRGHDLLTLLAACGVLAFAALVASFVPARRASAIDPMRALRAE